MEKLSSAIKIGDGFPFPPPKDNWDWFMAYRVQLCPICKERLVINYFGKKKKNFCLKGEKGFSRI